MSDCSPNPKTNIIKVKVVALYTFCPPPVRPVHSNTNSASPGSILATQQLRAKTKSLTFPPLSISTYSFKQLSQLGRQWRERKSPIFETEAKGGSNPGSLDYESGILPRSITRLNHFRDISINNWNSHKDMYMQSLMLGDASTPNRSGDND